MQINTNINKYISELPAKIINWLVSFYYSQFLKDFLFYAKAFAVILSIILFIAIILLFIALKPIEKFKKFWWGSLTLKAIPKTRYQMKWSKIERRMASRQEAEYKMAVIEADKLIDKVLFLMGYKGDTLGDKLKLMNRGQLESLDNVWVAHKLRNRIVHNPDEEISLDEAEDAIEKFKKALEELEVI